MKKTPAINSLVVFNHQPDATLFRVKLVRGYTIGVVDRSVEDLDPAIQWIDRDFAKFPSVAQLKQVQS